MQDLIGRNFIPVFTNGDFYMSLLLQHNVKKITGLFLHIHENEIYLATYNMFLTEIKP
jgi:hypothetical protein